MWGPGPHKSLTGSEELGLPQVPPPPAHTHTRGAGLAQDSALWAFRAFLTRSPPTEEEPSSDLPRIPEHSSCLGYKYPVGSILRKPSIENPTCVSALAAIPGPGETFAWQLSHLADPFNTRLLVHLKYSVPQTLIRCQALCWAPSWGPGDHTHEKNSPVTLRRQGLRPGQGGA